MSGLLKEKTEIENLKKEYQIQADQNFKPKTPTNSTVTTEELVLEDCES